MPFVFPELQNTLRIWLITLLLAFAGNLHQRVTVETFEALYDMRELLERIPHKDHFSVVGFFCLMVLSQKNQQDNYRFQSLYAPAIYTWLSIYQVHLRLSQRKTSSIVSLLALKLLQKPANGAKRQFWPKIFLSFTQHSCITSSDIEQVLRRPQENEQSRKLR